MGWFLIGLGLFLAFARKEEGPDLGPLLPGGGGGGGGGGGPAQDIVTASQLAMAVDIDLRAQGEDYDQELLKAFQLAAGFTGRDVDGLYGPMTRQALIDHGIADPPPPMFFARGTGGEADETKAAQLAMAVDIDLRAQGEDYDQELLKAFQLAAGFTGRDVDGLYGPMTRKALIDYGISNPPPPLY